MKIEYSWVTGQMLLASNDDLVQQCIDLYSNHYGVWGDRGIHPGKRVKLSRGRLEPWLNTESAVLYYATHEDKLIGYAIAIRAKSKNFGTISWVTQLVVHSEYRNQGIAKNILFSIWGFSTDDVWGIVSSNPYAIRALEKATRRRATPMRIKKNLRRLKSIGKDYVPYIDDNMDVRIDEDNSQINTHFFVSHENTEKMIQNVISENIPWLLGVLEEGWEWFAFTFKDQEQISLTKEEIANMVEMSDTVVQKAYENMILDPQNQRWMSHTKEEIDYILNKIHLADSSLIYDIGCGIGRHSIELAQRGYSCIGIDYIGTNIESASAKKAALGLVNVEFICSDCRCYVNEKKADLAICLYDVVGSFVSDNDNERIIKTTYDLLKPGGYAVFSVMNYETTYHNAKYTFEFDQSPDKLLSLTASNTMEATGNIFDPNYYIVDEKSHIVYRREQFTPPHQLPMELVVRDRRYSLSEISNTLQNYGFEIVEQKYVNASNWNNCYKSTDPKAKEILIICKKQEKTI